MSMILFESHFLPLSFFARWTKKYYVYKLGEPYIITYPLKIFQQIQQILEQWNL
mgnify:CR=1 FL=1